MLICISVKITFRDRYHRSFAEGN